MSGHQPSFSRDMSYGCASILLMKMRMGYETDQHPPFPAFSDRGRPVVVRVGVPLAELKPLDSSSNNGIGSRLAWCDAGETLVDEAGEPVSLGEGYVPYAMVKTMGNGG